MRRFYFYYSLDSQSCIRGSLDPEKAKGKIVVCLYAILRENAIDMVEMGKVVKGAGGVGMVVANDERLGDYLTADWHVLPATYITYADGVRLFSYLNSTKYICFLQSLCIYITMLSVSKGGSTGFYFPCQVSIWLLDKAENRARSCTCTCHG